MMSTANPQMALAKRKWEAVKCDYAQISPFFVEAGQKRVQYEQDAVRTIAMFGDYPEKCFEELKKLAYSYANKITVTLNSTEDVDTLREEIESIGSDFPDAPEIMIYSKKDLPDGTAQVEIGVTPISYQRIANCKSRAELRKQKIEADEAVSAMEIKKTETEDAQRMLESKAKEFAAREKELNEGKSRLEVREKQITEQVASYKKQTDELRTNIEGVVTDSKKQLNEMQLKNEEIEGAKVAAEIARDNAFTERNITLLEYAQRDQELDEKEQGLDESKKELVTMGDELLKEKKSVNEKAKDLEEKESHINALAETVNYFKKLPAEVQTVIKDKAVKAGKAKMIGKGQYDIKEFLSDPEMQEFVRGMTGSGRSLWSFWGYEKRALDVTLDQAYDNSIELPEEYRVLLNSARKSKEQFFFGKKVPHKVAAAFDGAYDKAVEFVKGFEKAWKENRKKEREKFYKDWKTHMEAEQQKAKQEEEQAKPSIFQGIMGDLEGVEEEKLSAPEPSLPTPEPHYLSLPTPRQAPPLPPHDWDVNLPPRAPVAKPPPTPPQTRGFAPPPGVPLPLPVPQPPSPPPQAPMKKVIKQLKKSGPPMPPTAPPAPPPRRETVVKPEEKKDKKPGIYATDVPQDNFI